MLVIVETNEDVEVKSEIDKREVTEMEVDRGKGRDKEEEKGRDIRRGTELETKSRSRSATGAGTGIETKSDEVHVPQGVLKNHGSTISLYIQKEIPNLDNRAKNVSRLLSPSMRECFPHLSIIQHQILIFFIIVSFHATLH